MNDLETLLRALGEAPVEFILIGGVAATVHGSSRLTRDLDIVYRRTDKNIERLVRALDRYNPYLRGAPPGLPFLWEVGTLQRGLNFTLATSLGALDLLGEIAGGGSYEELLPQSIVIELLGMKLRCLSLDQLIQVKRAAGRPKDLEVIAELEAIREEKQKES